MHDNIENLVEALVNGVDLHETADEEEKLSGALIAIVMSAQKDGDFGPKTVKQILDGLGMGNYWDEVSELEKEVEKEETEDQEEIPE
jgi:hypothetical protein